MPRLASYYFVSDLSGSTIPSSRLREILERLEEQKTVSSHSLDYLRKLGLSALEKFAQRELTYEVFRQLAEVEKNQRERVAEEHRQAKQIAKALQEAEKEARYKAYQAQLKAERIAYESSPQYIAKTRNKALRERYEIHGFIEQRHFARLMNILRRIDEAKRLVDDDMLWLATKGQEYFTPPLRKAFHHTEAQFFASEYERTLDPWHAVNASGHYRKCAQPSKANALLGSIPIERLKAPKLRSAIATTHGGVMRDLNELNQAMQLGTQAHQLTPEDFRPCTLLGAVNFELGSYEAGQEWYAKAVKRGAEQRVIDYDLRGILLRATAAKRKEIEQFLLRQDQARYQWIKNLRAK